MSLFSADEEKHISEAITAAEKKTSGEILAVVATQSGDEALDLPQCSEQRLLVVVQRAGQLAEVLDRLWFWA